MHRKIVLYPIWSLPMRRLLPPGLATVFLAVLMNPTPAHAKIVLITHGDTITKLGGIADNDIRMAFYENVQPIPSVGYHYSYAGVYWVDLWTWGGEYCLYTGDKQQTYEPISRDQAARFLGVTPDDLSKPFWYRFPPGLCILAGLALLLGAVTLEEKARKLRMMRLLDDGHYRGALEIVAKTPGPAGHSEAIQSLVREGIPEPEATKKLNRAIAYLAGRQQKGPTG
jgi:hypothetical protein